MCVQTARARYAASVFGRALCSFRSFRYPHFIALGEPVFVVPAFSQVTRGQV